jgi:hypothetical protein
MKYIRTKYEGILELEKTSKCIYSIRNKNVDSENCYVSYLWNNWKKYYLIDYKKCMLFSYNSAQSFISDLIKENLNYQDLVIELNPYYKDCKQADTIEELCDEFVIVFDKSEQYDNELFNAKTYTPVEVNTFYKNVKIEKIYGAIWTDKGLIYVAKMNEKGELELI